MIIGPAHPYGGGVAQHTARLASELAKVPMVRVSIESWKAQYPRWIHRFQAHVSSEMAEIPFTGAIFRQLEWFSPLSWLAVGLRIRRAELVLFSVVSPFQVVPYSVMRILLSKRTRKIGLIHNVLPHERTRLDRLLMRLFARVIDGALVHDRESARTLLSLSRRPLAIVTAALPSPWDQEMPKNRGFEEDTTLNRGNLKLLFFGNVRPYKGLDILIEALGHCPDTELLVAGKIWGDKGDFEGQIEKNNLTSRVTFVDKYIPVREFEELFRGSDILVMPYRSGTGSIVPRLAMSFGLPVIASDVGSISESIVDGANGIVLAEITPERLASAVCALNQDRKLLNTMKREASATENPHGWKNYVAACIGLLGKNEMDAADAVAKGFADFLGQDLGASKRFSTK